MRTARPRAYLVASAAYYPAVSLAVVGYLWVSGHPVVLWTVLAFLLVTGLAGVAVAALLRRQVLLAVGSKVLLVGILSLAVGTPLVVIPDLLFGFSGLHGPLGLQGSITALLVATLMISLNPLLWLVAGGWIYLLRRAALRDAPPA